MWMPSAWPAAAVEMMPWRCALTTASCFGFAPRASPVHPDFMIVAGTYADKQMAAGLRRSTNRKKKKNICRSRARLPFDGVPGVQWWRLLHYSTPSLALRPHRVRGRYLWPGCPPTAEALHPNGVMLLQKNILRSRHLER